MKDDETIPTVSCYYVYMSDNASPDTIPILVIRDRTTTPCAAAGISKTGVDQNAVQFFVGSMRELGWRRYICISGGEYSLVALKNIVRDAMPDVEMIPKESLVGDHAATGKAENTVREIKRDKFLSSRAAEKKSCNNRSGRSSKSRVDTGTRCKLSDEISHRRGR